MNTLQLIQQQIEIFNDTFPDLTHVGCDHSNTSCDFAKGDVFRWHKQSIIALLKNDVEEWKEMFKDEHPVDCIDGEMRRVETYGYEETHNNVLRTLINNRLELIKQLDI